MKSNFRRELDAAKNAFDAACRALSDRILQTCSREERDIPQVSELYYSQPNSAQAEGSLLRRLAALFAVRSDIAGRIAPAVDAVTFAARAIAVLKESKSVRLAGEKSARAAASSGYAFSAAIIAVGEPIAPGDYLLVRYGNGRQLVHVESATGPTGLIVRRLFCRGTQYAHWRSSYISRADKRILGHSLPSAGDPTLDRKPIRLEGRCNVITTQE